MDKESIPMIAFSASQGFYEWIVMSFGLKTHPNTLKNG